MAIHFYWPSRPHAARRHYRNEFRAAVFLCLLWVFVFFMFALAMMIVAASLASTGRPDSLDMGNGTQSWTPFFNDSRGGVREKFSWEVLNDERCGDDAMGGFKMENTIKFWVHHYRCQRFNLFEEDTCYILDRDDLATNASRIYFPTGGFITTIYHGAHCNSTNVINTMTFKPAEIWHTLPWVWRGNIGSFRGEKCKSNCGEGYRGRIE